MNFNWDKSNTIFTDETKFSGFEKKKMMTNTKHSTPYLKKSCQKVNMFENFERK